MPRHRRRIAYRCRRLTSIRARVRRRGACRSSGRVRKIAGPAQLRPAWPARNRESLGALVVDKHVGRFQIAMNDALLVGVSDCLTHRLKSSSVCSSVRPRDRTYSSSGKPDTRSIAPIKVAVTRLAGMQDGHDVRMLQARGEFDLAFEPAMWRAVMHARRRAEPSVPPGAWVDSWDRLVDRALPTAPNDAQQAVAIDGQPQVGHRSAVCGGRAIATFWDRPAVGSSLCRT
jgi:hypothetical protein